MLRSYRRVAVAGLLSLLSLLLLSAGFFLLAPKAQSAINQQINFQGKLTNPDGTNVTDGSYSLRFRIYTAATGDTGDPCLSSCVWEETQGTVSVTDGIFRVALGSVTALPGSVDFNTASLYLSIKVGADPEMSPRIRFTASPYAFNADRLSGLASTNFVQLAQGTQTDSSSSNASISINKTGGTALIFDLQRSGTSVLQVANDGSALFQNQTDSATGFRVLNQSSLPLLVVNTTTNNVFVGNPTADSVGSQLVVDTKNDAGDPTGVNGGIYYNSNSGRFRCFQNSVWSDCLSSANSHATFTSGRANVATNTLGQTAETLVFTSATGVSNTAGITGFTAPAGGSFRTCLVKNNAAITAGNFSLRWRVNGASVGATACNMNSTTSRESASALEPGVVTFTAGDTIGIAFDTDATYAPGTVDFTAFWSVEYNSINSAVSGATLQSAYDNGDTINTTDTHDLVINATDTATDANVLIDLQCTTACGGNGRFAVQSGGTDRLTVSPTGAITISSNGAATWGTSTGNLTLQAGGTGTLALNTGGAGTVDVATTNTTNVNIGSTSATFTAEAGTATTALFNGATAHTIQLATGAAAQTVTIGSTNTTSALTLNAGSGNLTINATSGAINLQTTTAGAINLTPAGTSNVVIGTSDTTGTLLVLDTKTSVGDPTGVNGGIYYNSSSDKFRCFEGSVWSDCLSTRVLGETTLGAAAGSITVNLAANPEYLHCRVDVKGRSAASVLWARFNGASGGTNYGWNAYGIVAAAVTDWQDASDSEIQLSGNQTGTTPVSADLRITNFSDTNKVVDWSAAGAEAVGTNSNRYSGVGVYYNTVSQISSVTFLASTGNLNSGTHAWCEGRNVP